jgi:hypothetical protein
MKKFTSGQLESVVNDVAEDMDSNVSREKLRATILYLANERYNLHVELANARTKLALLKFKKAIGDENE